MCRCVCFCFVWLLLSLVFIVSECAVGYAPHFVLDGLVTWQMEVKGGAGGWAATPLDRCDPGWVISHLQAPHLHRSVVYSGRFRESEKKATNPLSKVAQRPTAPCMQVQPPAPNPLTIQEPQVQNPWTRGFYRPLGSSHPCLLREAATCPWCFQTPVCSEWELKRKEPSQHPASASRCNLHTLCESCHQAAGKGRSAGFLHHPKSTLPGTLRWKPSRAA